MPRWLCWGELHDVFIGGRSYHNAALFIGKTSQNIEVDIWIHNEFGNEIERIRYNGQSFYLQIFGQAAGGTAPIHHDGIAIFDNRCGFLSNGVFFFFKVLMRLLIVSTLRIKLLDIPLLRIAPPWVRVIKFVDSSSADPAVHWIR